MTFFAAEQKVEQIFDFCAKKRDAAPQIIKRFFFHPLTSDSLARSKKNLESSLILLIHMPPPHPTNTNSHTRDSHTFSFRKSRNFFLKKSHILSYLVLPDKKKATKKERVFSSGLRDFKKIKAAFNTRVPTQVPKQKKKKDPIMSISGSPPPSSSSRNPARQRATRKTCPRDKGISWAPHNWASLTVDKMGGGTHHDTRPQRDRF